MAIDSINSVNSVNNAYQGSVQNVEGNKPVSSEVNEEAVKTELVAKKDGKPVEITKETAEEVKKAIEQINKRAGNTTAQFSYNQDSNKITVQIIDVNTEEVIQEFPPEKTLNLITKACEMVGLFVDEEL